MTSKYYFNGYITDCNSEKKTIKVLFNTDQATESIIHSFCKDGLYSPIFPGGFTIKYTRSTKFFNKALECTLDDVINNHVYIEACKVNYSYPNRTGWFLKAATITLKI